MWTGPNQHDAGVPTRNKTWITMLTMLGWHVAVAVGGVLWIRSVHGTTGNYGFRISQQALLWLGVIVLAGPALLVSMGVGVLIALSLHRRIAVSFLAGTASAALAMAAVVAGIYLLILINNK
jgi:hypothetical protein